MAGSASGVGTTYSLPNFNGELFSLSPAETPFLSAAGGLTGGAKTKSPEFEWQTYDLRAAGQNVAVEGADAPTPQNRVRGNGRNVCQIHQESVSVSYTKQGSIEQLSTPSSAPYNTASGVGANGQVDELTFQLGSSIKQIARDVNFSFWNGIYQLPTSNATPRQTAGLLNAVTTNVIDKSGVSYTGATSATDTITVTHALSVNDKVVFSKVGAANLEVGRVYYVQSISTTVSFKVAATQGGSALTVGTATGINLRRPWTTDLTVAVFEDLVQSVFDNGGLTEGDTATVAVNSTQKRALSAAYATAYDGTDLYVGTRNVGGVNLQQIQTDFGVFNLMLDRNLPRDVIAVVSLDEIVPVLLETPGKGVFFAEPLGKRGAYDAVMLYGEIGLKYGAETSHGVLRGLKV